MANSNGMGYLFNWSTFDDVEEKTERLVSNIEAMAEVYDSRAEELKNISLAEAMAEMGLIFEEKGTPGGYDMLYVGESDDVSWARHHIAAINAMVSVATHKYQTLEWHKHVAWFDPRKDAEGVFSIFEVNDKGEGSWRFFDWVNGAKVPSRMKSDRWKFQVQKHEELDRYLMADTFGKTYGIALAWDAVITHYQTNIHENVEKSITDMWEFQVQKAEQFRVRTGKGNPNTPVEPTKERKEFMARVKRVKTPHIVIVNTPQKAGIERKFDPANEQEVEQLLGYIATAKPVVEFVNLVKQA